MRKTTLALIAFMLLVLTSCDPIGNPNSVWVYDDTQFLKKTMLQVLYCLNDGELEGLKKMFCERVRETEYFDKEIDDLFSFFEGKITKRDRYISTVAGSSTVKDWEVIYEYHGVVVKNVKTDANQVFRTIGFGFVLKNKNHPDTVGINKLSLVLEDGSDLGIVVRAGNDFSDLK